MTTGQAPQKKYVNERSEARKREVAEMRAQEERERREAAQQEASYWRMLAGSPTMTVPKSRKRKRP